MWLYPLVVVLIVLCAAGAGIVGGVYMFFLIPLAVLLLIGGVGVALYSRSLSGSADPPPSMQTKPGPLPHRHMQSTDGAPQ
jgi:hypothetical protein